VGEEPALELNPVFGGAFARLQFVQGGFGAVDKDFVIDDRGIEGRDEFEKVGLAFDEVGEEIGILRGQGAELVEERLLGLQLLAERKTRVAVHVYLQRVRAGAHGDRVVRIVAGCWKFKVERRKFTDGCACRPFCLGAYS
jgi:hypothetical protein